MRQIYNSIRTLLHERTLNIVRVLSLSLGLTVGILLFSQIAYELSYENFYKDPEYVALMRCRRVKDGIPDKDYDDSTFRPAAADLWEALPDLIESASLSVNFYQPDCYIDDKKLKDMQANGSAPDVLTFAGNGEPTAHPYFPEIIVDTLALRDNFFF